MKITTVEIAGIKSATIFKGLPKYAKSDSTYTSDNKLVYLGERDRKVITALAKAKAGSGHDCFLKSINVWAEIQAPHYFWNQWQRYHFSDIISSSSKMHTLTTEPVDKHCSKYVSFKTIGRIECLLSLHINSAGKDQFDQYFQPEVLRVLEDQGIHSTVVNNNELFECILDNLPMGYQLTAGVTMNYLQLKTMYAQRKSHKLSHWSVDFVEWVKTLPLSYLITGKE